jgi:hypothetical protein
LKRIISLQFYSYVFIRGLFFILCAGLKTVMAPASIIDSDRPE